jgi:hypothetical protein
MLARSFSPCSCLKTRQTLWAVFKGGAPAPAAPLEQVTLTAVEVAGWFGARYGGKRTTEV